jgi:hypothetical protein
MDQRVVALSSLVTVAPFAAIRVHIPGAPRATPEPGSRAGDRRSSPGFPASPASAADWLSYLRRGNGAQNNIAAARAFADGGETAAGRTGIDVAYSFSTQGPPGSHHAHETRVPAEAVGVTRFRPPSQ